MKLMILVVATACLLATGRVTTGQELIDHPEVVLKPFDKSKLTVYGLKIGDDEKSIPKDKIDARGPDGGPTEFYHLTGGFRVTVANGKITGFALTWEAAKRVGINGRDDVEFVLGKADRADEEPPAGRSRRWRYQYLDRGLIVIAGEHEATIVIH